MSTGSAETGKADSRSSVSTAPTVRIPVGALGYHKPGVGPSLNFYSLVTLDFVDNDRLLFSFSQNLLMRRDTSCEPDSDPRPVRAVVLSADSGRVERQANWMVYGLTPYLWPIGNGSFLLGGCSTVQFLRADLEPHTLISLDGHLGALTVSPDHSVILVEEHLPAALHSGVSPVDNSPVYLAFIRLNPPKVLTQARAPRLVEVPIFADGFLRISNPDNSQWDISFQPFVGKQHGIATVQSTCQVDARAMNPSTFLLTTCHGKVEHLQARSLHGDERWDVAIGPSNLFPSIVFSADGRRLAVETVNETGHFGKDGIIEPKDVDGQTISVYKSRTGQLIDRFRTTPVYTAGRNFDLSPDGSRLAVVHDDEIEIYKVAAQP